MRFNSPDRPRAPRHRQELLADIYRRGTHLRRRRRLAVSGATAAVLALLIAVPALAFRSGDDTQGLATDAGSTTTTTEPSTTTFTTSTTTTQPTTTIPPTTPSTTEPSTTTTTTTTAPAPQRPAVAVAVTADNRLVVVDTADGQILRTLYQEAEQEDGNGRILGPSVAPDRNVYFSVLRTDCRSPIYRIPLTGGSPTQVAEGFAPVISPDGRRLAYAADERRGEESYSGCTTTVTVRELATGEERSWPFATEVDETVETDWSQAGVSQITWAWDSRRLAFDMSFEGSWVSVLDTTRGGTIDEASVTMEVTGFDGFQSSPAWLAGSDEIAMNLSSAYPLYTDAEEDNGQIAVVPAAGGSPRTLARTAGDQVATDLAVDASGGFTVWVLSNRGEGGGLVLLDADGTTRTLAGSFREVDW